MLQIRSPASGQRRGSQREYAVSGWKQDPANGGGLQGVRRAALLRTRRTATDVAHDVSHLERVWANAQYIARAEVADGGEVDIDVLLCCCLLFEIGRGNTLPEESLVDATVRISEDLLRREGLGGLVWPVCETLMAHLEPSAAREPTLEARILHDANLLDWVGAIGVVRALVTSANSAIPALLDEEDPAAEHRAPDPSAYLLDRFPSQLFTVPDAMLTAYGRAEAERRTQLVRAFHRAVLRDCGHAQA